MKGQKLTGEALSPNPLEMKLFHVRLKDALFVTLNVLKTSATISTDRTCFNHDQDIKI